MSNALIFWLAMSALGFLILGATLPKYAELFTLLFGRSIPDPPDLTPEPKLPPRVEAFLALQTLRDLAAGSKDERYRQAILALSELVGCHLTTEGKVDETGS